MRHKTRVFERFDEWIAAGTQVVVAIVIETHGSTYSKPGDFMLITEDGRYQGLLSGGCVEGDLAMHAEQCARAHVPAVVDYDLGGEHDALWGMGAGCDGTLRIVLLPVHDTQSMRGVVDAYREHQASVLAADWSTTQYRLTSVADVEAQGEDQLKHFAGKQLAAGRSVFDVGASQGRIALVITPAPRALLCGAGADAVPLAEILVTLGWRVQVCDHRSAYIDQFPTLPGVDVETVEASALSQRVDIDEFDIAMVMTHHLQTDATLLAQLAGTHWRYIAVLGPAHRKQRLLAMLDASSAQRLTPVLHGPAGLAIGGREPVSIALSIAAQMHQSLAGAGLLDSPVGQSSLNPSG
ncbi:MAG: XdhC family protein [Pseudomonadota bacterium]